MNALTPRSLPALLGGLGGCLFLVVWTSPRYANGLPPFIDTPPHVEFHGAGWAYLVVPIAATVVGLCALRWWPYLLVVAGLLTVPDMLAASVGLTPSLAVDAVARAGYPLAILGVLACAQSLVRDSPGWGAALTGLSVGAQLFGSAIVGAGWLISNGAIATWHPVLSVVGFVGVLCAAWRGRHGDPGAVGLADAARWSGRRVRLVVTGALVACLAIPLSLLTTERLADLLGVSFIALHIRTFVESAIVGAITLVAATGIGLVAGLRSLAGALIAATVRIAVVAPMIIALTALAFSGPLRWPCALAGVLLGAVAAGSRWRTPLASALTVLAAVALFIAYAATSGQPEKLADQRATTPAALILIVITAAATAVVGATAPVLAARGALPVMLGPVAAVLAASGLQTVGATYLRAGSPVGSYLNPAFHLPTSAILLLVAGAAIGGLGFAQQVAARRAEREQAEQIRRDAATAERERLARSIHDGVLQVLTLVQRHGSELGNPGTQLATLAAEQEVALRTLLTGPATPHPDGEQDLRAGLTTLASPAVEVAVPAEPVPLSAPSAAELTAAVQAALDNVRRHAGPAARAWLLLEDEGDAVRITVRDNGIGFASERLAEAAEAGRLGVAQSIRGRIRHQRHHDDPQHPGRGNRDRILGPTARARRPVSATAPTHKRRGSPTWRPTPASDRPRTVGFVLFKCTLAECSRHSRARSSCHTRSGLGGVGRLAAFARPVTRSTWIGGTFRPATTSSSACPRPWIAPRSSWRSPRTPISRSNDSPLRAWTKIERSRRLSEERWKLGAGYSGTTPWPPNAQCSATTTRTPSGRCNTLPESSDGWRRKSRPTRQPRKGAPRKRGALFTTTGPTSRRRFRRRVRR